MRALLIAAAGVLVLGAVDAASAADMDPLYKAPPVPVYYWSGGYVGGNVGGAWGTDNFGITNMTTLAGATLPTSAFASSRNPSGFLGGFQIGDNYMFTTHWVGGIEFDLDGASVSSSATVCPAGGPCVSNSDKYIGFGTGRLRLGYALDNVLLYGTGGAAWAQGKLSTSIAGASASNSGVSSGWTAGGGIEWAILPSWSVRAEYLRLQFNGLFNSYTLSGTMPGGAFSTISNTQQNVGINVVRVGLNYMFNWPPQPPPWK